MDYISKEAYKYTLQASRKTIQKKDIEQAVVNVDPLYFLEGTIIIIISLFNLCRNDSILIVFLVFSCFGLRVIYDKTTV